MSKFAEILERRFLEREDRHRRTTTLLANAEIVFLSVFVPLAFQARLTGTAQVLLKSSISFALAAAVCGVLELWILALPSSDNEEGLTGRSLALVRLLQRTVAPASFLAAIVLASAAAIVK